MRTILDIAGKPLPPRNRSKNRLRSQDVRDLLKIVLVILLIVAGFYLFVPSRDAAAELRVAAAAEARSGI